MPINPRPRSVLVDTNFLIYLSNRSDAFHAEATRAFHRLLADGVKLWMTSQNVAEFWAVATKAEKNNGSGFSHERAGRQLELLERQVGLLAESDAIYLEWRKLVLEFEVVGRQVYDTRLVAAMNVYGISTIVTKNIRDFKRYPMIEAIDPADLSEDFPSLLVP